MGKFLYFYWGGGLFLFPVSLVLGSSGGSPLEFLISDLMIFPSLLYFIIKSPKVKLFDIFLNAYHVMVLYFLLIALVSAIYFDNFSTLAGFGRFVKSTLTIIIAFMVAERFQLKFHEFCINLSVFFSIFLVFLFLSDVFFSPRFPFIRWGGNIFGLDVYGFPNAAASFYAVLGFLLFYSASRSSFYYKYSFLLFRMCIVFLLGAVCVMSLSRNAMFTYFLSVLLGVTFFERRSAFKVCYFVVFVVVFLSLMPFLVDNAALMYKLSAMAGGDALSGRDHVWEFAIDILGVNPFTGYGFYSFVNWGYEIHSLHNAYLDMIYKFGFFGLIFYFYMLLFVPWYIFKNYNGSFLYLESRFYFGFLFLIAFSGVSQETFSFSLNQSMLFFMVGLLIYQRKIESSKG